MGVPHLHDAVTNKLSLMCLALIILLNATGCDTGRRGGEPPGILNLSSRVPSLPEDNAMYPGPRMVTPRYGHEASTLGDGTVLISGGSDERMFTTLDSVELFDQSLFEDPQPPSLAGSFVDTDVNGDLIILGEGGRVFHESTVLPDGNVLISGGAPDILTGAAIPRAEIFDRQSRRFDTPELLVQNEMIVPRFRHTAVLLSSGKILITGGQETVNETFIDSNYSPGHPLYAVNRDVFPSTEVVELFDPATLEFELALQSNGLPTTLITNQGRSDHTSVRIAGFDERLDTADDLVLHLGGMRTFTPQFAPQEKFPRRPEDTFRVTTLEYYVPSNGEVFTAINVTTQRRLNGGVALNLGQFQDRTPDGVLGMSNVVLLKNGDDDYGNAAFNIPTSVAQSELIFATFTGLGPAAGVEFFVSTPPAARQNDELYRLGSCHFGRTQAPAVLLPTLRSRSDGGSYLGGWALTAGGARMFDGGGFMDQNLSRVCSDGDIRTVDYFDPFYDPDNVAGLVNDLTLNRSDLNPTGVTGAYLKSDEAVPRTSLSDYAQSLQLSGTLPEGTVLHTMSQIPGEDGFLNTPDDRVAIIGGGDSWLSTGGEPVAISCSIFVPEFAQPD